MKGGAFDSSEANYFRWVVGSGSAITALDEVVRYVGEGAVVQTVVPVELGYPIGDPEHDIVGPKYDYYRLIFKIFLELVFP